MALPGDNNSNNERPLLSVDIVVLPYGTMLVSPDSQIAKVEYFNDCGDEIIHCDTDGSTTGF